MERPVIKDPSVSAEVVQKELERILTSPAFETSDRNRRFLSHVVEETLAGRADRIKAYSIATIVFGREADFDPLQDSIVRIEAARLRRALEHFYLKDGDDGGIRISIPKGTYAPDFAPAGGPARMSHPGKGANGRRGCCTNSAHELWSRRSTRTATWISSRPSDGRSPARLSPR